MLSKLEGRLQAYRRLLQDWRLIVAIDQDDEDCYRLKQKLESIATRAGLPTRTTSKSEWKVANRIVVTELESWYFGDRQAVCQAYPKLPPQLPNARRYRNPDAIAGGAWEAFERVLQCYG